jgi:hypothetical protein
LNPCRPIYHNHQKLAVVSNPDSKTLKTVCQRKNMNQNFR